MWDNVKRIPTSLPEIQVVMMWSPELLDVKYDTCLMLHRPIFIGFVWIPVPPRLL